mgnify:CR=1 FL=1
MASNARNLSKLLGTSTQVPTTALPPAIADLEIVGETLSGGEIAPSSIKSNTLTQSFDSNQAVTFNMADSIDAVSPIVSVFKEVPQAGFSSKGQWDVNANATNYDFYDEKPISYSSSTLTPSATGDGTFTNSAPVTSGYDFTNFAYDNVTAATGISGNNEAIRFNNNGTKMYILSDGGPDGIYQFSLSTAYDITTASYDSVSFSVTQDSSPRDFHFNSDGSKMFILGSTNRSIYQFSLSTAYDLSTTSYDSVSLSVAFSTSMLHFHFNGDGTKIYVGSGATWTIYERQLPGAYDISSESAVSTFGYNDVEGQRIRAGGRTYFGSNDTWRIQGYTAYGFRDNQFKYGISGRWMVNPNKRLILSLGNRRDVEQMGVSLTTSNDVLGRSFASSALFASGVNNQLTSVNLTTLGFEIEPVKNFTLQTNFSYRTLKSASSEFSLDYYTDITQSEIKSEVKQSEINLVAEYTPKRKTLGYGVDRMDVDFNYARVFLSYSNGLKGVLDSDFNYQKLQFYYRQPALVGGFGRLFTTFETGKIFGEVPLGLMGVIPGNQSWFVIENTYNLLNYYDFFADEYASLHFEHHFNGRLFSRIPYLRKLNLREIIGIKGVYGRVSDDNKMLNASGLTYTAPEDIYWEYHAGVGNIFKVLRIDFAWRGSYLEMPDARKFAIRASFGFYF